MNWEASAKLEAAGRATYEFRAGVMAKNDEGLTKTYNRFHDPDESAPEILKLRELHASMDRAVLDAYGWMDILPICDFFLDYEEDEDDASGGRRKKPWRYRWADDVRDEVLARLLELNAQRAREQAGTLPLAGPGTATAAGKKPRARTRAKKSTPAGQGGLFGEESE
jgi:hypothetical protein